MLKCSVGDSVAFLKNFGAFAENCGMQMAFPIPKLSSQDSSWRLWFMHKLSWPCSRAKINKEDEVLVLGAAGGVGLAAVDIAKLLVQGL